MVVLLINQASKANSIFMSKYSTKFKRWFYQDTTQSHLRAFRNVWLSVMVVDGIGQLLAVYNGDFSTTALIALVTASANAVVKTLFQLILPEVIPAKTATTGQGSVSVQMTKGIDSVTVKKVK
tara:strand:+ start:193 stop:561 length:369 start_codon:yes stop_codon:yes gene_type:complete